MRKSNGRYKSQPIATRFFPRLMENRDCIEWQGAYNHKGYGVMSIEGRQKRVHHVSWFLVYGWWPTYIMHSCDNRCCVNPDHLSEGNDALNVADMIAKGRAYFQKRGIE